MSFEFAKEKALRYLLVSKKTEQEVRDKLKKLKVDNDIIDKVINYLTELNYINDEEYLDAYIRQCMRLLNYSVFEIKQKMLQKGIKKCIIEKKLDELNNTNYENDIINRLLNSKLKNMESIKQKQYLYRRGFKISDYNSEY